MTLQTKSHKTEAHLHQADTPANFLFWQRWLVVTSELLIIFGLVMAFLNRTIAFDLFNSQINPIFWGAADIPAGAWAFQGWIYGVAGAIVVGWGIFLFYLARYPFKQQEKWAWNCIFTGLLVWYVVDTFISVQFKVYFNAISNTVIFIPMILPLIFTRKYFQ